MRSDPPSSAHFRRKQKPPRPTSMSPPNTPTVHGFRLVRQARPKLQRPTPNKTTVHGFRPSSCGPLSSSPPARLPLDQSANRPANRPAPSNSRPNAAHLQSPAVHIAKHGPRFSGPRLIKKE
ncbi:unnamed protein product [Linum trigynum]|uniref:Uncharacterized protein n=1 Tax=Linum trigynum TaxID=586398 RepID=A0AAV2FU90_9ROSI